LTPFLKLMYFSTTVARSLPDWAPYAVGFVFASSLCDNMAAQAVAQYCQREFACTLAAPAMASRLRKYSQTGPAHLELVLESSHTVCQKKGCTGKLVVKKGADRHAGWVACVVVQMLLSSSACVLTDI
jgi:hypothetical protein